MWPFRKKIAKGEWVEITKDQDDYGEISWQQCLQNGRSMPVGMRPRKGDVVKVIKGTDRDSMWRHLITIEDKSGWYYSFIKAKYVKKLKFEPIEINDYVWFFPTLPRRHQFEDQGCEAMQIGKVKDVLEDSKKPEFDHFVLSVPRPRPRDIHNVQIVCNRDSVMVINKEEYNRMLESAEMNLKKGRRKKNR